MPVVPNPDAVEGATALAFQVWAYFLSRGAAKQPIKGATRQKSLKKIMQ